MGGGSGSRGAGRGVVGARCNGRLSLRWVCMGSPCQPVNSNVRALPSKGHCAPEHRMMATIVPSRPKMCPGVRRGGTASQAWTPGVRKGDGPRRCESGRSPANSSAIPMVSPPAAFDVDLGVISIHTGEVVVPPCRSRLGVELRAQAPQRSPCPPRPTREAPAERG